MLEKFKEWFLSEVAIFKIQIPRFKWLLVVFTTGFIIMFILGAFSSLNIYHNTEVYIFGFIAIILVLAIYILLSLFSFSFEFFISFVLIISGITFWVEKYALNNEVFPPFTLRTTYSLWLSFIFLFFGIFYRYIPLTILSIFPSIYIFGIYLCFAFILILLPLMVFSWILIPFMGLGLLPYSPILAAAGFLFGFKKVYKYIKEEENKNINIITHSFIFIFSFVLIIYSSWYIKKWNDVGNLFQNESTVEIGHENIYNDLPEWVKIGLKLEKTHVTEQFLQPFRNSRGFQMFDTGKLFDPLSFLASLTTPEFKKIDSNTRVSLLKLLYNYSHDDLERLWDGNSLVTTKVSSHVQIYPNENLAYTETTLEIYNEKGAQGEAIYTIIAPEGSIATKMSLWIGDREEEARLTFKSKAKKAYTEIVGVQRRDPSLLEWLPSGKFRLRVFPIQSGEKRTVRIGMISFLKKENEKLIYESSKFLGVPFQETVHDVYIDVMSNRNDIVLNGNEVNINKKIVSDGEVSQWEGKGEYKNDWKIEMPSRSFSKPNGIFQIGNSQYRLTEKVTKKEGFIPKKIFISLSNSKTNEEWINFYNKLNKVSNAEIYFLTGEVFHSKDNEKVNEYLRKVNLPAFQLFPFYKLKDNPEEILVITASNELSVPWQELKNTNFAFYNEEYFAKGNNQIKVAALDSYLPEYFKSFEEWGRVVKVSNTEIEILQALQKKEIEIPVQDDSHYYFPGINISIIKTKTKEENKRGNDFLARLVSYRILMQGLGKKYFSPEIDYEEYFKIAEDAFIVTPVTSLIALETEDDYKRFGIDKNKSELGQTKIKTPGLVPEPEEWFFMIIIFSFLFFFYRKSFNKIKLVKFIEK